ncbi:MAG: methyltransferase domain-containing protein [Thiobacillus sp.]|nr:methyltransferase domain-containing protein [Thiobacillus sp.]
MDLTPPNIDLISLETPPAVAGVRRIADGFKAFQVLRAGLASGLFDWLEQNGPAKRPAIATALKLRGAHLAGFMQALEDLGLIVRQGALYGLAPGMREAILADSPWYQRPVVESLTRPGNGWADFSCFMAEDRAAAPTDLAMPPWQHVFLDEARGLALRLAARDEAGQGGAGPRRLLCFDGGGGAAAAALCLARPRWSTTAVVPAAAVLGARTLIASLGLDGRCRVEAGTPLDFPADGAFDRVVLFHVLYAVRKDMAQALGAIAGRLAPGGELCSAHWFCLEACETAPGGLRDLDRAVLLDHHPLCHVESFGERFVAAGLDDAGREEIDGPYGHLKLHFAGRAQARQTTASSCARHGCC